MLLQWVRYIKELYCIKHKDTMNGGKRGAGYDG